MSKFVMVDAMSIFRMRYVVEVPDECPDPEAYAKDSVVCGDVREFSQDHLDEIITLTREVTYDQAIEQHRVDNPWCSEWSEEIIEKNAFTEIGYSWDDHMEEEKKRWLRGTN
jgi:hypothetical protein